MSIFPVKILLATDGSEDAALAAKAAADLSRRTGSELHVVHAWRPPVNYTYPSITPEDYASAYEKEARELLDAQVENLRDAGAGVAGFYLKMGRPSNEILILGEEVGAGLILLGSRGLGAVRRLVLGSVSEGVVHHARVPVMVMRGGDGAWPPERVLFGDDGSEEARGAGEFAASIGNLYGVQTLLVNAHPEYAPLNLPIRNTEIYEQTFKERAEKERQALETRAGEIEDSVGTRPEVEDAVGDPAVVLDSIGKDEKGLIAVGSHGRGAVGRMLLGSVSTKVLRVAKGPVLVCPRER